MNMRSELEPLLGIKRKSTGGRDYYDCPHCTVKDPQGQLVVSWGEDKFVCNHMASCGFGGTISKSLGYELGIKKSTGRTQVYHEPKKKQYKLNAIESKKVRLIKESDKDYSPRNDRVRQIRALFPSDSQ